MSLARDASSAGDRIAAEAYYQHAEHYFRILSDSTDPTPGGRRPDDRQLPPYGHDDGYYGSDEDDDAAVNGHPARQYEARGNGNPSPQPHRDAAPRDSGPRGSGPGPRDAAPRQPQPLPAEANAPAANAPAAPSAAPVQAPAAIPPKAEPVADEARPRRGRPRKPRASDDGQAVAQDNSSETEGGPAN